MSEEKNSAKLQKSPFERFGHNMKMWAAVLGGLAALVGSGTTLAVKGVGAWHEIHPKPTVSARSSPPSPLPMSSFSSPSPLSAQSSSASFNVPSAGLSTSLASGQPEPAGCSEALATTNTYLAVAKAANDNHNLPAVANAFEEMHTALTSDESLAGNTNVQVATYELATDANNIAYEMGNDELTAASGAVTKFGTDFVSLDSACNS